MIDAYRLRIGRRTRMGGRGMRSSICRVFAAALLGLASPALVFAQPVTGSNVKRGDEGLTGRYNHLNAGSPRPGINAFFRCKASLDRPGAGKVLELPYMSKDQVEMIDKVGPRSSFALQGREDCFSNLGGGGVQIQFDPVSAVGGFAEFFILRGFDVVDAERLGSLSRDDWQLSDMKPRNGSEMIGLCTAQAAGADVYRILETLPASDEEMAAIQKVVPFLGPCLTDGVEVSFDAASLRGLLAHSLYKALTGMKALEKAKS